jgi:hypothetical protein
MNNIVFKFFIEHPSSFNMTYLQHFTRALSIASKTGIATIVLLIHSQVFMVANL